MLHRQLWRQVHQRRWDQSKISRTSNKHTFWAKQGAAELQVMVLLITSPAVYSDDWSYWWKMRFYATRRVVLWQTGVRNSWSVLMKLMMNYCFKWQNVLLSCARSPGNVLRRTLLLCVAERSEVSGALIFLRGVIIAPPYNYHRTNASFKSQYTS